VLVLGAPRPVFAALRDDTSDAAAERAEPVLLVVWLTGCALAFASQASTGYGGVVLPVWLFLAGGLTGAAAYWVFGAVLFGASRALGSLGSYRRARHVLAYACVPLASSLLFAPSGHGPFGWIVLPFVAWSAALLAIGVRTVHGWSWPRAAAATAAPVAIGAVLLAL
jgi:hypothetical protein